MFFSLLSYVLNTTVELPHEQRVASLEFRPSSQASSPGMEHMLVTTSADGKFKTWVLEDDTDIYSKFVTEPQIMLSYFFGYKQGFPF